MKKFLIGLGLAALLVAGVEAGTGDLYDIRGNPDATSYRDIWRVNSAGHFVPTGAFNLGNSTNPVQNVYANDFLVSSQVVTANTTLTATSPQQILIGTLTGNITITIPAASSGLANRKWDFQDVAGTVNSVGNVTIAPASGTVNGAANVLLSTQYGGKQALCTGTVYVAR